MRSDLKGTLTFIVESAVDDHTVYTPATGTAPGGIIDNTGPTPITKSPIYSVFSDPSEIPEPSPMMAICVAVGAMMGIRVWHWSRT
jgi:hypothetical protein